MEQAFKKNPDLVRQQYGQEMCYRSLFVEQNSFQQSNARNLNIWKGATTTSILLNTLQKLKRGEN